MWIASGLTTYSRLLGSVEEASADLGPVPEKELDLAKMMVNAGRGSLDATKLKEKFNRGCSNIENRAAAPGSGTAERRTTAPVMDIMTHFRRASKQPGNYWQADGIETFNHEEGQATDQVARRFSQ